MTQDDVQRSRYLVAVIRELEQGEEKESRWSTDERFKRFGFYDVETVIAYVTAAIAKTRPVAFYKSSRVMPGFDGVLGRVADQLDMHLLVATDEVLMMRISELVRLVKEKLDGDAQVSEWCKHGLCKLALLNSLADLLLEDAERLDETLVLMKSVSIAE